MSDLFATPSDLQSGIKAAELEGCLVVIRATGDEVTMETSMGTGIAAPVSILVVDGPRADLAGNWISSLFFGKGLLPQIAGARRAGKPLVGVMGKGQAQPGKTPAWRILDPTEKQVELAREAYVKSEVGF